MADYPGANSNNTMGANLKEVYSGKSRFKKIKKLYGR